MAGKKPKRKCFNYLKYPAVIPIDIIMATKSQDDEMFGPLRNTQCTSISVYALCVSKVTAINNWNSFTIDNLLVLGTDLHRKSIENFLGPVPDPPYLCADEVYLKDLSVDHVPLRCIAITTDIEMQGYVDYNFEKVIEIFFVKYAYGVFTSRQKSVALMKNAAEFWVYDPHSCNPQGLHCKEGVSVACKFHSVKNVISFIRLNFYGNGASDNSAFVIVPFSFDGELNIDTYSNENLLSCEHDNSAVHDSNLEAKGTKRKRVSSMQRMKKKKNFMKKMRDEKRLKDTEYKKSLLSKNARRVDEVYKNEGNRKRSISKRTDEEYKKKENQKNLVSMRIRRLDKEYKKKENQKKLVSTRTQRLDKEFQEKEKQKNLVSKRKQRTDEEYKKKENQKNLVSMRTKRLEKEYKKKENQKNLVSKRTHRTDEEYKKKENQKNLVSMRIQRLDKEYKKKENQKNLVSMRTLRLDDEYKKNEKLSEKSAKELERSNEIQRYRHYLYNKLKKESSTSARAKLAFINSIKNMPDYVCFCCEGLFFKHSVVKFNSKLIHARLNGKELEEFCFKIYNCVSPYVCKTCKGSIAKLKVPKMATSNGLKFVDLPDCVKDLSPLEERLCSPYIPFMQMRPLKTFSVNPQLGAKGSVVNIPIEINDCLHVLPRSFDDMATVQLQLKRHLMHKTCYMYETIRPAVVCKALEYLLKTPLYVKNGISIDRHYLERYENRFSEQIEFVVDGKDASDDNNDEAVTDDIEYGESEDEFGEEVLIVDRNQELSDEVKIIAPGQDQKPVAWHLIENIDELCFPKIFAGHPFELSKFLTYNDRAKSECRRVDRRSCSPGRILFLAKQKLEKQCVTNINVCLRKTRKNTGKINAGEVLKSDFVSNLIKVDSGYQFIKEIRSSPAFWEKKKKDLLAMIRQLGKPTLFLTLSAAEARWPELIAALSKINLKVKLSIREAQEMSHFDKTNLIRNDPITCARYFDYKIFNFLKLIRVRDSVFEDYPLIDWYQRVEFQMRGSPHEHMFLWLENAPEYDALDSNSAEEVVTFIDAFITCECVIDDPYVALQRHKHSHTCYKGKKKLKMCRFHFPLPVMPRTCILVPLSKEENTDLTKDHLKRINTLMDSFFRKPRSMSFENILTKLDISEEQYMLAVRHSLKQTRVFLKRSSLEVGINCYNRDILHLFESNMDIQFVLEEYGLASYIINYISKVDSGVSKLLRNAAQDVETGNDRLKQKFRKIANVFLNSNLMSSQEAAYCILSLPLSKSSRKVVFINTSPQKERVVMLKGRKLLEQLPEDSDDIYMEDQIQKYCRRSKELENVCLAEYVANFNRIPARRDDDGYDVDVKARQRPAVIRYRRYKVAQDPENYYREQVLLLFPFRDEVRDIESKNCYELFIANSETIEANRKAFGIKSDESLEDALHEVNKGCSADDSDESDSERGEAEPLAEKIIEDVDIFVQDGMETCDNKQEKSRYSVPARVTSDRLWEMMNCLNDKQREFVMHVLNSLKICKTPMRIFLSGSAGVGKSTVINALHQLVTHYFDSVPGGDKDKLVVLLCAPSGKAAFLIGGVTLHTAFALPVSQFSGNMPALSSDVASSIREKLFHLKLLIIDEVSMVGSRLFCQVDTRLRQITGRNQSFGGISVIVVGDLHQLPPVMDSPVYKAPSNEFAGLLDGNPLWEEFAIYELTQVMRQKNELKFIRILNNLSVGSVTSDDEEVLNTRVVKSHQVPDAAIRLFTRNVDVHEFNEVKLTNYPGETFQSIAKDVIVGKVTEGAKSRILNAVRSKKLTEVNGLPHDLKLKVGIKYMVTSNVDVEDGLVNGACGTLSTIVFKSGTSEPLKIFMDFGETNVGRKARMLQRDFAVSNKVDTDLTPIDLSRQVLNISNKFGKQVVRIQFPLVCAEALTIHKSQGQTYDAICVDFNKCTRITRSMLYVALSRVRNLQGLYIVGKFKKPLVPKDNDPVISELNRLKSDKSLTLFFNNLRDEGGLKIVYQNVCSLTTKLDCIFSDAWYGRADVLIFSETLTKSSDHLRIPGFTEVARINYELNGSRGMVVLARDASSIKDVRRKYYYDASGNVDFISFEADGSRIICGYKSPKIRITEFEACARNALSVINPNEETILLGDFNFDVFEGFNKYVADFLKEYGLTSRLKKDASTTNFNTQIDIVFANVTVRAGVYETYFSDHKPVYAILGTKNT